MKLNILKFGIFIAIFSFSWENGDDNQAVKTSIPEEIDSNTISNNKDKKSIETEKNVETASKAGDLSLFSGQAEIATYTLSKARYKGNRSEEHTSELQSRPHLVC